MKLLNSRWHICLVVFALLLASLLPPFDALAQDDPPPPAASGMAGPGTQRNDRGLLRMEEVHEGDQPKVSAATGGPDDYGYVWDSGAPFTWIDATGGTDTGLSGDSYNKRTGPIALPFPFKYYAGTYTTVYIGASGYLSFQDSPTWWWPSQLTVPSPSTPNASISPYSTPLTLASSGKKGRVFYRSGGTAPGRYFVVAWNEVTETGEDDKYTFEVVLYENGNIHFQYKTMTYGADGGYYCGYVGIEDADGLDGFKYAQCDRIAANTALRFTRPPATARVKMTPRGQGRFTHAGGTEFFQVDLFNNGELGADTYNLTLSSAWSAAMWLGSGQALEDTNGDGVVDTGPVAPGQHIKVSVQVKTPAVANVADNNTATLAARSVQNPAWQRSVILRTTVPVPFAQVYQDAASLGPRIALANPDGQTVRKLASSATFGQETAVAATPTGGYFYVWDEWSNPVWQLRYALLDSNGALVSPISTLPPPTGTASRSSVLDVAAAVAPDGKIGLAWIQVQSRRVGGVWEYNDNAYMAIFDAGGALVSGPLNLTNNSGWGPWEAINLPGYSFTQVAASGDNRFFVAWSQDLRSATRWTENILYTVYNTAGQVVKPLTRYSADASTDADRADIPRLATLSGNRFLLTYYGYANGIYGVRTAALNSAGERIAGPTAHSHDGEMPWAITQFSNGSILVVWMGWANNLLQLYYVVLNDGTFTRLAGPTLLENPSSVTGDFAPSVTADADNRAIVTWGEEDDLYRPYHFYALIGSSGALLSPATPGLAALVPGNDEAPAILSSYGGYGVAPGLTFAPVSATQPDAAVNAPALNTGAPGGGAQVNIRVSNLGLVATGGFTVTAELDPMLTYQGATPAPTQQALAAGGGGTITWDVPSLRYLSQGLILLDTGIPTGTVGTRYPVTVTVSTPLPEHSTTNNTVQVEVMAAEQVFLPKMNKSDE